MEVVELGSAAEVVKKAASIVADSIIQKPDLVLGLATGETMVGVYAELVRLHEKGTLDFSKVRTFNLDEYVNVSSTSAGSFRQFMEEHFFRHVNLKKKNIHFLRGDSTERSEECKMYEDEIKKVGGVDLQILGLGRNGHIGFNEPGSKLRSKTREVVLRVDTRKDNSAPFGSWQATPEKALTMGIATILSSKKIILLAFGSEKEDAVRRAVRGKISENVPASFLQKHKDATFLLDGAAAAGL